MANYAKTNIGNEGRVELHDTLSLTGAEISINDLPAGANVPFVHSHKNNEEVYGILSGKGKVIIDGEEIALTAGDWVRLQSVSSSRQKMKEFLLSVFRPKRILWKASLRMTL